ncbi:lipopolysaccharide biosynthesis protein [Chitinophaga pinensis]|uniref:Polysaccharide biosynthesis protein n=1 Tax=Chitinophaga pinensis (strain ATCC 43595 / DSM 2588 / LMG 13176 / NBRC 15968 / NCIMB 11800 / UQM 2034) TaxID=485918 RepID=A0A979G7E2_CHIPD|nr:oligosaccharide flippase family protein [Chitinophaga pinensis]ACU62141.1 polysaccharide biosynthesis protein [Chitinophaga pinensis DSM 2588]
MSELRKKSIVSIVWTYVGFIFGAINVFLSARYLLPEYNGLTRVILEMGVLFSSFATFGVPTLLGKFYPYYKDRMEKKHSDLLTLALVITTIGFILLSTGVYFLKPFISRKFSGKSPLLVDYYYLALPITFFLTYLNILEAHAWNLFKTVISNFFKEVAFRIANLLLLAVYILNWISFETFIMLFSLLYGVSFLGLLIYMISIGEMNITFNISKLTRRLWTKMLPYVFFMLASNVVLIFKDSFDGLAISSMHGLEYAAVFVLVNYLVTSIGVPQRSVVSIAFPIIARAWKEKNMGKLADVYTKTSITLLLISTFLFGLVWINFDDVLTFLKLPEIYRMGKTTLLLLAIAKIVELGTGASGQIIISSRRWKFESYSNMILLAASVPVNYYLIKHMGIPGAGWANLILVVVFNGIRFAYLWYNYKMQPFNLKTVYGILLPVVLVLITTTLINFSSPLLNIILRSVIFVVGFISTTLLLEISEDATGVFRTVKKRLGIGKPE